MLAVLVATVFTIMAMASAKGTKHQITVTNSGFSPSSICIPPGDSIGWYFQDAGHNVEETTGVGSCTSKNTFKSTTMQAGWRWSREFKTPGIISYMSGVNNDCANGFKGEIYVQENCASTSSGGNSSSEPSITSDPSSASPTSFSSTPSLTSDADSSTFSPPSSQSSSVGFHRDNAAPTTTSSSTRNQVSLTGLFVVVAFIYLAF
jgi:plastocyanin